MIGRNSKIKNILDKIAVKRKQLKESNDLFERQLLEKELRDLEEILKALANDGD